MQPRNSKSNARGMHSPIEDADISPQRLFSAAESVLANLPPDSAGDLGRAPAPAHLPLIAFTRHELVVATQMLWRMGFIAGTPGT